MQIKSFVYENLTTQERIIATIDAKARGDDEEANRLVNTCPKKTYMQADAGYADKMQTLASIAMAMECEMRGYALTTLMALRLNHDSLHHCLQHMADMKGAWRKLADHIGVEPETLDRYAPSRHFLLEDIEVLLPKPDAENVEKLLEAFKRFIN